MRDQLPWDAAVIGAGFIIAVLAARSIPDDAWERWVLGGLVLLATLGGAVVLVFLWSLFWAPVNHARKLTRQREYRDETEQHILRQFDHLYKYGILLKAVLADLVALADELRFTRWSRTAQEWERLLMENATAYLLPFEAQRLKSDAGLALRDLPGASKKVNSYHRHMDAVLQRLEKLIERQPWRADAE